MININILYYKSYGGVEQVYKIECNIIHVNVKCGTIFLKKLVYIQTRRVHYE